MLLVYLILIIVSACVTIVAIYLLLCAEDYRWQWTSFMASGSTALYVFLYAIYYFFRRTNMTGFLQTCFYFGYSLLLAGAIFVMCGTVGVIAVSAFVHRIYRGIKIE